MVRIMGRQIRIRLLWKMALVALIIAVIYDLYFTYYMLPRFQSMIVQGQEAKAQQRAEVVVGMLDSYYALETSGVATRAEAQAYALSAVAALDYSGEDGETPFWVTDYQPVLLADASQPGLTNSYVGDVTDERGNQIYGEAINIAGSEGQGFFTVYRPGEKMGAYVTAFEPWDWAIGTDVSYRQALAPYISMRNQVAVVFGAIGILAIVLTWVATRQIMGKPLSSLVRTSEALAQGDVEQSIDFNSTDEIGTLAAAYSKVVDYMKEMAAVSHSMASGDLTAEVKTEVGQGCAGQCFLATDGPAARADWQG